jgi:HSP20 family protein
MFKLRKVFLSALVVAVAMICWSIPAVAMGAKDKTVPIKNEGGRIDSDMIRSIDELINRRWPDLFDMGLSAYAPRMNIQETPDSYQIEAELPGVKKEDIKIALKDDFLVISGEKKSMNEEKKDQYRRLERSQGSFYRTVSIPRDVDKNKISAELSDGILKIDIGKTKDSQHLEKKIIIK